MGKRIRRNYDENFKTKVVLEAFKEQKILAQLSGEFELNANQISDWKKQAIIGLPLVFGVKKESFSLEKEEELTAPLYQQIGQLKVELDFLKKKLRKNL